MLIGSWKMETERLWETPIVCPEECPKALPTVTTADWWRCCTIILPPFPAPSPGHRTEGFADQKDMIPNTTGLLRGQLDRGHFWQVFQILSLPLESSLSIFLSPFISKDKIRAIFFFKQNIKIPCWSWPSDTFCGTVILLFLNKTLLDQSANRHIYLYYVFDA